MHPPTPKTPSAQSYVSRHDFSDHQEPDLIMAAVRGDQSAFCELCRRHSGCAKRAVIRIARNREDAEDALQDAMLRAYLHLNRFDRRSSFSTWFTRIAINAALMRLRKDRTRRDLSEPQSDYSTDSRPEVPDGGPTPDSLFAAKQTRAKLLQAMDQMRPKWRRIVELRYFDDCSLNEAAATLNISLAAAKGRLFHARNQLKRNVKKLNVL
jgi:RNA polymerase sigma-70 factor, ECF subfamily